MKRGGPAHPKTQRLAIALDLPLYAAVGLLEMLWHFTAQYAPAGDLGKFSNREIEAHLRWQGMPDALVAALLTAGFVDEDPTNRLVVHDWHDHADQAVQRVLSRRGESFVTAPKRKRKASSRRLASELAPASLARGNGNGLGNGSGSVVSESSSARDEFLEFYDAYPRHEARDDAEKAWRQTATLRPPFAILMATVHRQKAHNFSGREKKHIPLPASWLRGGRWKDEIVPYEPPKAAKVTTMDAARSVAAQWIAEGKIAR